MSQAASSMTRISEVLDRLLDPEKGCPWDKEQTPGTLKKYLLEEIYEFMAAIEELNAAADKIIRRHPHVFGEAKALNQAQEVKEQWHELKQKEDRAGPYLSSVPRNLPALMLAHRLTERAGRVSFDWNEPFQVLDTLEEEVREFKEALKQKDQTRISSELGDILFTVTNLARHLEINAEEALQTTNKRFRDRFNYIEEKLTAQGVTLAEATLAEMDELWAEAKASGL
ncbi:MAG: MazG family protein [Deltaproteobacteria bacterium]|nr:MazG family protein [Deltaproteobacteria bacterium]